MTIRSAAIAAIAIALPVAASAGTVNVSINTAPYTFASFDVSGNPIATTPTSVGGDGVTNDDGGAFDVGFWTATYSFNLASAADTLSITDLAADDRTVVELNGSVVAAAGIFGPGLGTFIFTPTGGQVPQAFAGNGAQSITVNGPFVAGLNTIELIVNNTNDGIFGGLTGGPTSLYFTGAVTSVPEPATWALMLAGVGLMGASLRRRDRRALA